MRGAQSNVKTKEFEKGVKKTINQLEVDRKN